MRSLRNRESRMLIEAVNNHLANGGRVQSVPAGKVTITSGKQLMHLGAPHNRGSSNGQRDQ